MIGGGYLLNACDMSSNILDSNGIFYCEAVALALHSCLVNQYASVSGKT